MLYSDNFFFYGLLDEELSDVNFYGYDVYGLICLGDDNNIVFEFIEFEYIELLELYVLVFVDFLVDFNDMGVDLFCKVLFSVSKSIRNLCKLIFKLYFCLNLIMGLFYISY